MRTIGYPTFLSILEKRLKGKYSIEDLNKVLTAYTAGSAGILKRLEAKLEFKDKYFGIFRFTAKGFENYSKIMEDILLEKAEISRMKHKLKDRKLFKEKKLGKIWKVKNALEGHKYVDKKKKTFAIEKAKITSRQMNYMNNRLRTDLVQQRKTRKTE